MKVLIVSATPFELAPLMKLLESQGVPREQSIFYGLLEIQTLITGVGSTATAFALGHTFAKQKFDLAIQAGIGGAFDPEVRLGTVFNVVSEQFGDLGVEEADGSFTDVFELELVQGAAPPFTEGKLLNPAGEAGFLPSAKGLTVNKVHGSGKSIAAIRKKYDADIESMEGAAFFYACLLASQPFLELRSISNHVEPRNRENWDLPKAIDELNKTLIELLDTIKSQL
ncbi:MAG: futalosine hydrolase [Bacteroidetes bacterium]|nr:MAG: futalosine hydrolase [Bacteroidota bacterium]